MNKTFDKTQTLERWIKMTDEIKRTVDDKIEVILAGNDDKAYTIEYKTFVDKMEELYKLNSFKAYDKFNISLLKDEKLGWGLIFTGTREESVQEKAQREGIEGAKRKQLEAAELKEYLRLHKKYGKQS
ncbi:MAG: hypothetical protein WC523_04465 [Patescibacteria group bacterium]